MSIRLKRYQKDFAHSYSFGVFPTLELLAYRPEHVAQCCWPRRVSVTAGSAG